MINLSFRPFSLDPVVESSYLEYHIGSQKAKIILNRTHVILYLEQGMEQLSNPESLSPFNLAHLRIGFCSSRLQRLTFLKKYGQNMPK